MNERIWAGPISSEVTWKWGTTCYDIFPKTAMHDVRSFNFRRNSHNNVSHCHVIGTFSRFFFLEIFSPNGTWKIDDLLVLCYPLESEFYCTTRSGPKAVSTTQQKHKLYSGAQFIIDKNPLMLQNQHVVITYRNFSKDLPRHTQINGLFWKNTKRSRKTERKLCWKKSRVSTHEGFWVKRVQGTKFRFRCKEFHSEMLWRKCSVLSGPEIWLQWVLSHLWIGCSYSSLLGTI